MVAGDDQEQTEEEEEVSVEKRQAAMFIQKSKHGPPGYMTG